jgi:UDP-glucose 4-epimerase
VEGLGGGLVGLIGADHPRSPRRPQRWAARTARCDPARRAWHRLAKVSRSLVTGGAGFIGSHLVEALVAAGDEVLVLDDLSTGHRSNLAAVEGSAGPLRVAVGDISETAFVAAEIGAFEPERAFHLAAQADVRKAVADPAFDARVNVLGTVNVLEALRNCGGPPLVFTSTGGVIYGEGEGRELPFREDERTAPETAYGASKLAGEVYLGLYRRLHRMPALALRLGNVYGPRQDPHGEAGVVAIFCGRILAGEPPTVFGDGLQTRDYVHVSDVVAALLAASSELGRRGPEMEGPFNVGTGRETSVLELIEMLGAAAGHELEPVHRPARAGEIQRVAIDPAAAGRELGWSPSVEVREGLAGTYEALAG